jgi:hypothetical protein
MKKLKIMANQRNRDLGLEAELVIVDGLSATVTEEGDIVLLVILGREDVSVVVLLPMTVTRGLIVGRAFSSVIVTTERILPEIVSVDKVTTGELTTGGGTAVARTVPAVGVVPAFPGILAAGTFVPTAAFVPEFPGIPNDGATTPVGFMVTPGLFGVGPEFAGLFSGAFVPEAIGLFPGAVVPNMNGTVGATGPFAFVAGVFAGGLTLFSAG